MRQRFSIPKIKYKEDFSSLELHPYPPVPDEFTMSLVHANSDLRTAKIFRELPDIEKYLVEEEDHPAAGTFFDELRVAGFVRLEGRVTEFITPDSRRTYTFVPEYKRLFAQYLITLDDRGN